MLKRRRILVLLLILSYIILFYSVFVGLGTLGCLKSETTGDALACLENVRSSPGSQPWDLGLGCHSSPVITKVHNYWVS